VATTEQKHRVIAPEVRIEQTRRRLARLRDERLVDRITLPQAGRTRVWFPTAYGVQLAPEWPELRVWGGSLAIPSRPSFSTSLRHPDGRSQ
jgi:hypothetical protein